MGQVASLALTVGASVSTGGASTVAGLSIAQWASAASIVSGAVTGITGYLSTTAAAKAAKAETAEQIRNIERQEQIERTQKAIDDADSARRERRSLAKQRASLAGFADQPGTALNLQSAVITELNIQSQRRDLASDVRLGELGLNKQRTLVSGFNRSRALRSKAKTNLLQTVGGFGSQVADFASTLQPSSGGFGGDLINGGVFEEF